MSWVYSITFQIKKDTNSGDIENKIKELGETVDILNLQKQKVIETDTPTKPEPRDYYEA
jgi:hypothetical protein